MDRLLAFSRYYSSLKINGLHYVYFDAKENTLAICNNNHTTHHLGTAFLIKNKFEGLETNTVRSYAQDVKKFLDYLSFWELDLRDAENLRIVIVGFIDYLRLIPIKEKVVSSVLEWTLLKEVPLNEEGRTYGKVIQTSINKFGSLEKAKFMETSISYLSKTVDTILHFIEFLQKRSESHVKLNINVFPKKRKKVKSILAGTLGEGSQSVYNVASIIKEAGLESKSSGEKIAPLIEEVFTIDEANQFLSVIDRKHRQTRFLFYLLKHFGLRVSEAANLQIDVDTLPKNLLTMEYFSALEHLKEHLRGDIEFSNRLNKWVCYVKERDNQRYDSQHKSGDREIPLIFSSSEFLDMLLDALKERYLLARNVQTDEGFLFLSNCNRTKGKPITGSSVGQKFSYIVAKKQNELKSDFTPFSPHTFRHFYATYLLKVLRIDISDVSRWLGHSSVEVTRTIYSHYLATEEDNDYGTVSNMHQTLGNTIGRKE